MKYEDKKNLIIIFIMIAFLAIISVRRFEEFEYVMEKGVVPEIKMPKLEMPDLRLDEHGLEGIDLHKLGLEEFGLEKFGLGKPEKPLTIEEIKQDYKIFISPDKTIQMKYPSYWKSNPIILKKFKQQVEKYKVPGSEILFVALQVKFTEMPPVLIITSMPPEKGLEQVIEKTREIVREQQVEVEIISQEIKDDRAYFEIRQKREELTVYLRGKIVFTEKRNYLITVLLPEKSREIMSQKIDFIFNSIETIAQ